MRAPLLVHASWIGVLALLTAVLAVLSATEVDIVARAPGRLVHTDRVKRISATYRRPIDFLLAPFKSVISNAFPDLG